MKPGQHVPLRWPSNWPRSPVPRVALFAGDRTHAAAVGALVDELETKGFADGVVVASGNGLRASIHDLKDHGAAVYFTREKSMLGAHKASDLRSPTGKTPYVLACDTFEHVADNVWALKLHVESIRRMERNGVGTTEQILSGFKALPPSADAKGEPAADVIRPWREVLNFDTPIYEMVNGRQIKRDPTLEEVKERHKQRVIRCREEKPDGSHPYEPIVNNARDEAVAELSGARTPGAKRGRR